MEDMVKGESVVIPVVLGDYGFPYEFLFSLLT